MTQLSNQITVMNTFTIWTHLQPFSKQIGQAMQLH